MSALFLSFWLLLLLAFLIGSIVTWVILKVSVPHVEDLEAQTGRRAEGVL